MPEWTCLYCGEPVRTRKHIVAVIRSEDQQTESYARFHPAHCLERFIAGAGEPLNGGAARYKATVWGAVDDEGDPEWTRAHELGQ